MQCKICKNTFKKKSALSTHLSIVHNIDFLTYNIKFEGFKIPKCPICNNNAKHKRGMGFYSTCGNDKCINAIKHRPINNDLKQKISKSMKKAHAEGRANNWQDSKKHDNSSYPEIFFENVILNEFKDKNYIREYRFKQFSIDFAWVSKKLAIEIDGKQHEYTEIKNRDQIKDSLLKQEGWKVLRIKWKDMFDNPQLYISISKNFIDNIVDYDLIPEYKCELDYDYLKSFLNNQKTILLNELKLQILNSNIDFSKQGWVKEVAIIINKPSQKVTQWMRKNMYDFWSNNCFKRKGTIM